MVSTLQKALSRLAPNCRLFWGSDPWIMHRVNQVWLHMTCPHHILHDCTVHFGILQKALGLPDCSGLTDMHFVNRLWPAL